VPATTTAFLNLKPDGGNVNGAPETAAAKFEINGGTQLSDNTEMYYNAAYISKKVNSLQITEHLIGEKAADFPYLIVW
jgi:iron complex outermembrane receptor protein